MHYVCELELLCDITHSLTISKDFVPHVPCLDMNPSSQFEKLNSTWPRARLVSCLELREHGYQDYNFRITMFNLSGPRKGSYLCTPP